MFTKTQLKKLKNVMAVRRTNQPTVKEMREGLIRNIKEQVGEHAVSQLEETEDKFIFGSQFFLKPKQEADVTVELEFRSNDYIVHINGSKSYGPAYKDITCTEYGFYIHAFNGVTIEYHLQ